MASEKDRLAKAEAEAAKVAQLKAEQEAEKKRKEEVAAASKSAKEEAEKKAAETAKKAKEEAEKKLAESEKAHKEAEKKAKELEEEKEKNKPTPDQLKAPIKFKDAIGRKFSFPWHLCKTWRGMEGLIKQAFMHIDLIGDQVHQGMYDLKGPDDEIILPQVWETVVKPNWEISMHMWPVEKKEEDEGPVDLFAGLNFGPLAGPHEGKRKKDKGKDGKKKKSGDHIIDVPPPPMMGMPPPPPPGFPGHHGILPDPLGLAGMHPGDERRRPKARSSKSSKDLPPLARWMVGTSSSRKK